MRRLCFAFLCVLPAFAAIDGTVTNETTGKPQANVVMQIVQPGQGGMKTLGTTKTGPDGKFQFDQTAQGPTLLQAIYQGVLYNKMITPGSPSSGLEVPVFDSSKKPAGAKIEQHFILLQPTGSELRVTESFIYQGDPKLTFNDPTNGTLRFYLPTQAAEPHVVIQGPGGMPIQRPAQKSKEPHIYQVDYAVKPGETRFDVNYTLPQAKPLLLAGKLVNKEDNTVLVVPNGVTIKSDNLEDLGQEPKTQATIYRVKAPSYDVIIEGTGSVEPPREANQQQQDDNSGMPTLVAVNPRLYDSLYWIVGLTAGILILASVLLYRSQPATGAKK